MKPIYFPFTYIPESKGKALAACFGQTVVYQISATKVPDEMQKLVKEGILDIRIPLEINGRLLDKILKEYRIWINTHQGTETAFLKLMADKIPFFDKNASSQIRADIKKTIQQIPTQEKPGSLFNVGLFLHMAQEYDLQNERLSQDLVDMDTMEADFMKDLKGEDENNQDRTIIRRAFEEDDPGLYMTLERIEAWASFMLKDPQDSGLFITTSRAVLEHIIDSLPETKQIIRFESVPTDVDEDEAWNTWRNEFMKSLEMLAAHSRSAATGDIPNPPEVSGGETKASVTLFMAPEKTPHDCFAGFVDTHLFQAVSTQTSTRFKNTLIGLVEKR
ncbi:MAG: hypothetical protein P8012_03410 [Desulfobacterales bacterium]